MTVAALLLLIGAQDATAMTRFAAPGGTGAAPCTKQADPCRLFEAADLRAGVVQPNDEVILAPGTYSDDDLGPTFELEVESGVHVHGEANAPRPLISSVESHDLILLSNGGTISHLELRNSGVGVAFLAHGGVVEDVVATSTGPAACDLQSRLLQPGLIRDTVCLSSASDGVALEISGLGSGAFSFTPKLRNLTAIASGPLSKALHLTAIDATSSVSAKSVIAEGALDIEATALGSDASATVDLKNSDYDSVNTVVLNGAVAATVTAAGTDGNIEALPLLAADGYHELPGSPTLDAGLLDAESGSADIDGQPRSLGAAADIGADELTSPPGPESPPPPPPRGSPATTLRGSPKHKTTSRLARFRFDSDQPGSSFECKLDRKAFRPCVSPFVRRVRPGPHVFRVRAVNLERTADPTPAVFRWKVSRPSG